MNPEEIKVGDKVLVEAVVHKIYTDGDIGFSTRLRSSHGYIMSNYSIVVSSDIRPFCPAPSEASHAGSSAQAGKYDPCRKFRKGDIVEPCQVKGRWLSQAYKERHGIYFIVTADENEDGVIWVKDPDSIEQDYADAVYFQLVTPVEELGPYSVREADTIAGFDIMRYGLCVMTFPYGPKEAGYYRNKLAAKAAAEAERDRLNAEHRKEVEK